jgi:acetyl esterase/lipase
MRIWDVWKYGAMLAFKATEIAGDALSHSIWGPRKKSWGIEMTLITSLMRDVGRHSALVDIATIRTVMSFGGLVPLPSDALVTPVTFRVRKRNLRGILTEFDALEDDSRELSGEWVVGKKLWQRLQAEWKNAQKSYPKLDDRNKRKERVVLYLHGGAYYISSAAAQRLLSIPLSKYTDTRVFALDYRLAPETNFPGPLHDAVSGYFRLTEDLRIPPENIILAGDSAGGGLCLALLMYLRDNDYPMPSGAILMSPWVDLTMSCDSWDSNAAFDVVPVPGPSDHLNPVGLYLGDDIEKYLTHPYASPLFGDFRGLPPLLIQAGDSEVLRDEITLLAHKASLAGVDVQHELYEDCVHVFQAFPFLDAARRAFISSRNFVRNVLPRLQARSPQLLDGSAQEKLDHEIDSENVRVVRGDGVETGSGKQDVTEEMQQNGHADKEEEYSSWGRSRSNSILHPLTMTASLETKTTPDAEVGPSKLRRIQSALAFFPSEPSVPPTRNHRRTPSAQSARPSYTMQSTGHLPIPTLNMSKYMTPAPSPSIRRKNTSHPDITCLVEQWTSSGPANQTKMYKPYTKPS